MVVCELYKITYIKNYENRQYMKYVAKGMLYKELHPKKNQHMKVII